MSDNNQAQWMNIADVMAALMMIFMFIAIVFLYQLQNQKNIYKVTLNEALHKEFDRDLERWQAIITDDNIIRFSSPFKTGSDNVPFSYQLILDDFFPRYISLLLQDNFKKEIEEIRVEGHTSYGWGDLTDEREIYIYNMQLSQQRASNVLSYCYSLNSYTILNSATWLQKHLRANGMAYSQLLYIDKQNTIEDNQSSKRVEFRVIAKDHKDKGV